MQSQSWRLVVFAIFLDHWLKCAHPKRRFGATLFTSGRALITSVSSALRLKLTLRKLRHNRRLPCPRSSKSGSRYHLARFFNTPWRMPSSPTASMAAIHRLPNGKNGQSQTQFFCCHFLKDLSPLVATYLRPLALNAITGWDEMLALAGKQDANSARTRVTNNDKVIESPA